MPRLPLLLAGLLLAAPLLPAASPAAPAVRPDPRPWTRWWWPGNAVDRAGVTRQLEAFARAGLGGVEITPIYGARGAVARALTSLSPAGLEMLEFPGRVARRLGLGVDLATGTGWPFGGPRVAPADGSQKLVLQDGRLAGTPTGMKVKRAAPGAEGRVLDPYSRGALGRYLEPFTAAFAAFPRELLRGQFHDSFEYYDAGWTPALTETFARLHGYDLQEHAAELVGAAPADADALARLKGDYRAALAALHLDYLGAWRDWAHAAGWIVRNQSHGAPANLLDLYGAVDIPETETFGATPFPIPGLRREWSSTKDIPNSLVIRMASSAAHVMGRPLASSETCTWLREHWQVALAFAKPEIDRLFSDGINHIFYHGTVYSPPDAPWPGWLFYASTQFNPNNSWWDDFAALNAYVTRVQSVLQAGQPDNDVLLYWPFADVLHDPDGLMQQYGVHRVGWLADSAFGRLAATLLNAGHAVDYVSDAQLLATRAEAGTLVTPGGSRYRAVVVPATRHLPVETLEQLIALKRAGATVVFEALPADVPGAGHLAERRARFQALRAAPEVAAATGPVLPALAVAGIATEVYAAAGLSGIRRARADGHDYFLANLTDRPFAGWLPLARAAEAVTVTDPLTGRSGRGALRAGAKPAVYLELAPGESLLLHAGAAKTAPAEAWTWFSPAGEARPLTGTWTVTFGPGGPAQPAGFTTAALQSWTELGDDEARRFAGTARYRIDFDLPADSRADDWLLDLGDVRESARITLNGTPVATAWSLPFRVRLGPAARPGRNRLELDVTNLAANRIRDLDRRGVDWKVMHEINFVNLDYQRFDASGWPLAPSGLLGPVRLIPLRKLDPATAR